MKKIIVALFISIFLISGCGLFKKVKNDPEIIVVDENVPSFTVVNNMKLLETSFFFPYQIDSVIKVEHIKSIDNWHKTIFIDIETKEPIYQFLYIKTSNDATINYKIYKLPQEDSLYVYKKIMYN